jgi:hypothetical protein
MRCAFIIASALLFSSLSGQNQPRADSAGTVTITTEPAGADVYIDSLFVGKSPLRGVTLERGSHRIRAFYPSVFAWNASMIQDSLTVTDANETEKRLELSEVLRVQSDPPGGIVRYRGAELGPTPLYTSLPSMIAGDLVVQKEGYDSLLVPAGERTNGLIRVKFSQQIGGGSFSRPSDVLGVNGAIPRDYMMTYVSGAAMIVSGVASAVMKDRANRNFDAYLLNNNPADLSATRRLDRGAAATLIVSQISFAVLAYFLLSE